MDIAFSVDGNTFAGVQRLGCKMPGHISKVRKPY
jgi:hypothetical protein